MDAIANGDCVQYLKYLLDFLAAWKERPAYLTPMAYRWCSAFSEMATGTGQNGTYIRRPNSPYSFTASSDSGDRGPEIQFTEVGPGCDRTHCVRGLRRNLNPYEYVDLPIRALEIGFRQPGPYQSAIHHTSHHNWMFGVAFSSNDDEIIADAMCAWIADSDHTPAGSFVHYFAERVENTRPFPPRLREACIHAICHIRCSELTVSALETVRLLNRLEADVDDTAAYGPIRSFNWVRLLVWVIRSPSGFESLSSHNWCLLGKLTPHTSFPERFALRDVEVMRLLEEAEDWEKLEVWMEIVWRSLESSPSSTPDDSTEDVQAPEEMEDVPTPESVEGIEQATLKLFLRQPSALQRFENLCEAYGFWERWTDKLKRICDRARAEQLPSEPPPPPYVSVPSTQHLSILIPHFSSAQSIDLRPATDPPSFLGRQYLLRVPVVHVYIAGCSEEGCRRDRAGILFG